MIRDFEIGDELKLKGNEFSSIDDISDVFTNDLYYKYTLEDDGEVKSIMCLAEYERGHFAAFFLMEDGLGFRHVRELKRFVHNVIMDFDPVSIMTYSHDDKMLNRWHEFLGFEKQRATLSELTDDFNRWILRWE